MWSVIVMVLALTGDVIGSDDGLSFGLSLGPCLHIVEGNDDRIVEG